MRKYMELKINYEAQENDRQVLLNEVVIKKKRNAILFSQIEEYKQLFKLLADEDAAKSNSHSQCKEDGGSVKGQISNKKNKHIIDFAKIDHTSQHLAREQLVLDNLKNLLEREKKRYFRLKKHFDSELLRQTPIEVDVKETMRDFIKKVHIKNKTSFSPHIQAAMRNDQAREIEHDTEFYRLPLTLDDRRSLVDQILNIELVDEMVKDKLEITEKMRKMTEFDPEN